MPMDEAGRKAVQEAIERFSSKALRTLAIAYRKIDESHLELSQKRI